MNHKETIEHKRWGYCSVYFFMVKRNQSVYLTFGNIKRENQAVFKDKIYEPQRDNRAQKTGLLFSLILCG